MMPIAHKDAGIGTLRFSLFTKPSYKVQTILVESLAIAFVTKVNIREYGGPFEQTHVCIIAPYVLLSMIKNSLAVCLLDKGLV
jgi:hypothetical protein